MHYLHISISICVSSNLPDGRIQAAGSYIPYSQVSTYIPLFLFLNITFSISLFVYLIICLVDAANLKDSDHSYSKEYF